MFKFEEQKAIEDILLAVPLRRGQEWLINAHLDDKTGYGWGPLSQRCQVTTWGGTLDGIRGLLASGVNQRDSLIVKSIEWMLSQQKPDGSFESREITWSSVEVSAWVVIVLREVGYSSNSKPLQDACKFLEKCVQANGGLGTSDKDDVRIYPSAITLWALHGLSTKEDSIADFLLRSIDKKSGGWGNFPKLPGNVATTAHVLYVLLRTGHLHKNDDVSHKAVEFIFSQVNNEGFWNNLTESWFSVYQTDPRAAPNRCEHYSTTWVLQALLEAGVDPFDPRIIRASTWLVSMQEPNGAWVLAEDDIAQHIWCTANCMITLTLVRSALMKPVVRAALKSEALLRAHEQKALPHFVTFIQKQLTQANVNTLILLILFLVVFSDRINQIIQQVLHFLQLQQGSILSNIISSIFWVILVAVFASLTTFFKRK